MSDYRIFQVDAFASKIFRGNPAAIVPLTEWLDQTTLQQIAVENNLSETAFFIPADAGDADFHLRWFTPVAEVDLCGHATLAAAHVLFHELGWHDNNVRFSTGEAGILTVSRLRDSWLQLDFPARPGKAIAVSQDATDALMARPESLFLARDHMAVFATESEVARLAPDMKKLARLNEDGMIVTAPADNPDLDFISRFFAPHHGIPEDPVTGSAHCTLIPYWAERLGKTSLQARQISARGGDLTCRYLLNQGSDQLDQGSDQGRVTIAGQAITYLQGRIFI